MKALVALSTFAICSIVFGSSAALAESGAGAKQPAANTQGAVHSKAWLETKLHQLDLMIEKDRTNAKLIAGRGQVYYELKDYDKSISDLSKAISMDSTVQNYFYYRALSLGCKKQLNEAIADLNKAIKIGPERSDIHYKRGSYLYMQKRFSESSVDAKKAIELAPGDFAVLVLMAGTEFSQKRYQSAVNWYTKAISLNPKNGDTYILRSDAYKLLGNSAAAQKDQDKARELNTIL